MILSTDFVFFYSFPQDYHKEAQSGDLRTITISRRPQHIDGCTSRHYSGTRADPGCLGLPQAEEEEEEEEEWL